MSLATFLGPGVRMKTTNESTALRIGADILNWQQEEQNESNRNTLLSMLEGPGLFVSRDSTGQLGGEWLPYEDPDNAGFLLIGDAAAYTHQQFIDSSGYRVVAATALTPVTSWAAAYADTLQVPTDSTWRTLVVRRASTRYAPGKITFTNTSATIAGVGTDLTRFAASTTNGMALGTRIRVDTADNATLAGTYYLATVTSATAGTITTNAPGTATVPFTVVGSYLGTEPAINSDKDIFQRIVPKFELVARTVSPTAGDLILADVWYDGATLKIRDRRKANLAFFREGLFSPHWMPALQSSFEINTTDPYKSLTLQEWTLGTADNGVGDTAIAYRGEVGLINSSQLVRVYNKVTTNELMAGSYDPHNGAAGKGTLTELATVFATGSGSMPALLYTKTASRATGSGSEEDTLICAYVNAGKVFVKLSVDQGSTWTGGGAATWDPTAIDAADTVSDPCIVELRNGRIRICCIYFDNSASEYSVRSIYSDTAGATWVTNTNAGYTHVSGSSSVKRNPSMAQDIRNGRIWLAVEVETASVANISVGSDGDETGQSTVALTAEVIGNAMDNSTPTHQCQPVLWCAPNGALVCVYVERLLGASGFLDLRYSVIGGAFLRDSEADPAITRELHNRHIQRLTDATAHGSSIASATDRVRPALCQAPWGTLYVAYVTPGPSGGGPVDQYCLKMFDVQMVPVGGGYFC